ncbi:Hfq-related RNA-binding protein [Calothrix sp. UHCC 0171]|uniref:Hfq-related RNA-binding protein n=1 Tax=Calothrix sp. UHCC 0171 TaxID=3110245 RepID=UPI002B219F0C|nr:RNA-binding protein hfq [Calothrix sp. UHCC 0171]MEA5572819.1 RNA-binding protein hfq [Calothrix sp. UHCC 0171]
MLTDFDTSLPSIRQVQNLIKDTATVELKLLTGDILTGKILWQDPQCVAIADQNGQKTTVWKQAIAYIKPQA